MSPLSAAELYEIGQRLTVAESLPVARPVRDVLADVRRVMADYARMREECEDAKEEAKEARGVARATAKHNLKLAGAVTAMSDRAERWERTRRKRA